MLFQKLKDKGDKPTNWLFKPILLLVVLSTAVFAWLVISRNEIEIFHFFQRKVFRVFYPEDSPLLWIIALLWLVAAAIDIYKRAKNRYKTTELELFIVVTLVVIYTFFRLSPHYIFLPESLCIKYLDIPVIYASLRIFIGFVNRLIPIKSINADLLYKHGSPVTEKDEDELDYFPDAEATANEILQLSTEKCWRYGIVGKWGSGKSSYVNFVLKHLENNKGQKTIHIRFTPRSSASIASIQTDFFGMLAHKLKSYSSNVSWLIPRYMQSLSLANTYTWLTAIASLWRENNAEKYRGELANLVSSLPGKLIIVIDDFDRLSAEEIVEVLKLMGTNASFNNLVYIVEYDEQRVEEILSKRNYGKNYIQKYIDINKNVPYRLSDKYYIEFKKHFDSCLKQLYKSSSSNALVPQGLLLKNEKRYISRRIKSMRDVHILLNAFCADYRILAGEVNVDQLLLLSVIKAFHSDEYELIKNYTSSGIIDDSHGYLMFSTDNQPRTYLSQDILLFLFKGSPTKEIHDICDVKSFPLYIGRDMRLSFQAMKKILSKEGGDFEDAIRNPGTREDLDEYLNWRLKNEKLPETFEEFSALAQKIIDLAYCSESLTTSVRWLVSTGAKIRIQNQTKVDKEELNRFMEKILFIPGSVDAFCLCLRILKDGGVPLSQTRGKYHEYVKEQIMSLCDNLAEPVLEPQERMIRSFLQYCTKTYLKNPMINGAFLRLKDCIYEVPSLMIKILSVSSNLDGQTILDMDEEWQNLLLNDPDFSSLIRGNRLILDPMYGNLYLNLAEMADYLVATKSIPTKFPCLADNDGLRRIALNQESALAIAVGNNVEP